MIANVDNDRSSVKKKRRKTTSRQLKPLPNVELLRAELDYDPATGELIYKQHKKAAMVGTSAAFLSANRGVLVTACGQTIRAARAAWLLGTGEDPTDSEIVTINGDAGDLRLSNLKRRSRKRSKRSAGTQGVRAVKAAGRTFYRAQVTLHKRSHSLGQWLCPLMARTVFEEADADSRQGASPFVSHGLQPVLAQLKEIDAKMQSLIKQRGFSTSSRKDGRLYYKATLKLDGQVMRLHSDNLHVMQQAVERRRAEWLNGLRKKVDAILAV